jgi:hypothetical protein
MAAYKLPSNDACAPAGLGIFIEGRFMNTEMDDQEQTAQGDLSMPVDLSQSATAHPMRNLLLLLPHLPVNDGLEIDYEAADPDLLVQLADNAETITRIMHMGISAVGQLLAHSASKINCGELAGDTVEALGWLLAELGEVADVAQCLAIACRKHTFDYTPQTVTIIHNVKGDADKNLD